MIDKIDISKFEENSYIIDNFEIVFSEEGLFIFSPEGLFTEENFKKIYKTADNFYMLINEDKDCVSLTEEQFNIISKLIKDKGEKVDEKLYN